jgi:phosphoribosylformimino-5-aminoimidazole carboxamide ribotide isomerase
MSFFVIPAVDLKDGKCVRLIQGDPKRRTIELDNPLEVAIRWEELGAKKLHIVDLDGALQGVRKNESILKEIASTLRIPVQFGGGIRSFEDACRLLDFGVEKIILGTAGVENRDLIQQIFDKYGKERLIIALDSRSGKVVTEGWVRETGVRAVDLVKSFEGLTTECLFTNVDVEGMVEGMDIDLIKEMVGSTKMGVIASGGVSTLGDVKAVREAGASGVVIGTALYKKQIDFKDALELEVL